jgi:predicted nucleic acid-binding protein
MMTFVDTNYFVRVFVADDEQQTRQAIALFERAEAGSAKLMTLSHILFELAWTLSRHYKVSKADVIERLEAVMMIPNLYIPDRDIVNDALIRAKLTGSEFADSYIVAAAEKAGVDNVATFNINHFSRLGATIYEG